MNDYDKIAKAINYIRENVGRQPTLEDISAQVHLSPYHFQRLFSRWAGVSPKRFLQVLTLQNAKQLLKDRAQSVLAVSDTIGLSSGSRLYDHFVSIDAVTPSQYKSAGLGLTIRYGCHSTPFGHAFIASTSYGICKLSFIDSDTKEEWPNKLQQEWPKAAFIEDQSATAAVLDALFSHPHRSASPISLWVRGTNFQINVWQALLNIESGTVSTYGDIAKTIGKPKAARAVGAAVGANPIALIIPCHRVIQQSGALGGYRWGETRKHAILSREAAVQAETSILSF
jgi:AraC family transcriptional regulator of adaptative response/methylated-DNA-[protein]-cysteine methyltransferase